MSCCVIAIVVAVISILVYYWNSSLFLTSTTERLSPSLSNWKGLDWDYLEPLTETYIIDQHYPNIIETVLLRRPWTQNDFLNTQENKVPMPNPYNYESLSPHYDYRCILGGDIYFDSRHIQNVWGPYITEKSDRKQERAFTIKGYVQAIPFENKTYPEVCKSQNARLKWEGGDVTKLPFGNSMYFTVGITERWQKYYKHSNWTCDRVIFEIKDYMTVTPGFSFRDAAIKLGVAALTSTSINQELLIYPGKRQYAITPRENWPSFDRVIGDWGLGDTYSSNRIFLHTTTHQTVYY